MLAVSAIPLTLCQTIPRHSHPGAANSATVGILAAEPRHRVARMPRAVMGRAATVALPDQSDYAADVADRDAVRAAGLIGWSMGVTGGADGRATGVAGAVWGWRRVPGTATRHLSSAAHRRVWGGRVWHHESRP
jgi:hypothetical protein